MESFNFGAFDPTIGARIAAIPQEAQKQQTANMLQAMQVQGAMNQNELSKYTLASAQRSDASQNAVNDALKRSIVNGVLDYDALTTNLAGGAGAAKIPDFLKARSEELERKIKIKKLEGEVGEQAVKAIEAAWKPFSRNAFTVRNDDNNESIIAHHNAMQADPLIGPIMRRFKTPEKALKDDIAQLSTPAGLRQWVTENTNLDPKELARLTLQITKRTENVGDKLLTYSENPLGQQIGPIVDTPIQMTPGQVQAAADAKLLREQTQRNVNNPSLSIQQTPTGLVGVNPRTGIATPVVYGQQETPGISMTRQPQPVTSETVPVGAPGTRVMGIQTGLKPIPANINLAILANNSNIKKIDDTIKAIKANPEATGLKSYLPSEILNRAYPEGIEARAGVADVGSLILHDRSGAAVTASESPRLVPFIPLPTDNKDTVIRKLTRLRNIVEQDQSGLTETYSKDQGYIPNPTIEKTDSRSSKQQLPPIYATNGKERIMSTDGGQNWVPVNK